MAGFSAMGPLLQHWPSPCNPSHPDTQRYRLGGNYLLLPVNAPKAPYRPGEYDGVMNFMIRSDSINYYPR